MREALFKRETIRARTMQTADDDLNQDYWLGYQRGLKRRYHGEIFGTDEEHELFLNLSGDHFRDLRRTGYRDGFFGPVDWDNLPEAVRILRIWRGWSVDEMGERLGRSGRTIENWEQGHRQIPEAAVKALHRIHQEE